jgi:hypothetical protein
LIHEWKLRVIHSLSVIVGKKIVEELELRILKGIIKMWQDCAGPSLGRWIVQ